MHDNARTDYAGALQVLDRQSCGKVRSQADINRAQGDCDLLKLAKKEMPRALTEDNLRLAGVKKDRRSRWFEEAFELR